MNKNKPEYFFKINLKLFAIGKKIVKYLTFVMTMDIKNIEELKSQWSGLVEKLSDSFGEDLDLQGIIFLIGVQELGKGKKKYSKDEKEDLMHIATCRLLSACGYYELEGIDEEGWPHYKLLKKLPPLSLKEQDILLKQLVIDYFKNSGVLEE